MYNQELYHHGVKGMKWGVRRYQNKDGSLTKAGKKHYKDGGYSAEVKSMSNQELRTKINRMNLEKRYHNMTKNQSKVSSSFDTANKALSATSNAGKMTQNVMTLKGKSTTNAKIVNNSVKGLTESLSAAKKISDIANERKVVTQNRRRLENMSDRDLEELVNRMDLERQYSSLQRESIKRGKITTSEVLEIIGDVLAIGVSATSIAIGMRYLHSGK